MRRTLGRILERYGQEAAVNGQRTRALIQPKRERDKSAPFAVTPIGAVDDRDWVYLGQAEVSPGDRVETEDGAFLVRNARAARLGGEVVYWWAAMRAEREAAE